MGRGCFPPARGGGRGVGAQCRVSGRRGQSHGASGQCVGGGTMPAPGGAGGAGAELRFPAGGARRVTSGGARGARVGVCERVFTSGRCRRRGLRAERVGRRARRVPRSHGLAHGVSPAAGRPGGRAGRPGLREGPRDAPRAAPVKGIRCGRSGLGRRGASPRGRERGAGPGAGRGAGTRRGVSAAGSGAAPGLGRTDAGATPPSSGSQPRSRRPHLAAGCWASWGGGWCCCRRSPWGACLWKKQR